jgi:hypothetical protein
MNVHARQSTMLHSHFVKLYSTLKQGIRVLSLKNSSECPDSLTEGDKASDKFVDSLFQ